jgi:small subunit ribosomal protein S2
MADVTMRRMLEAGVHFGHQTRFWNPKMAPYIFGERNKIHIINLEKTLPLYEEAANFIKKLVADGGHVLFVGSKRAARQAVSEAAVRCGMPYVSQRWLGGMLTNFKTIRQSIKRLHELEELTEAGGSGDFTKKEVLRMARERDKLQRALGGIKEMDALPDAVFVIDVGHEEIAVKEACKLGIAVVAIVDTNCTPSGVDYPIPGNDDAMRAIQLYADGIADAVLNGKASIPDVPTGDGEFVELDAEGRPITESARSRGVRGKKAPAKKRARVTRRGGEGAAAPAAEAGAAPVETAAPESGAAPVETAAPESLPEAAAAAVPNEAASPELAAEPDVPVADSGSVGGEPSRDSDESRRE